MIDYTVDGLLASVKQRAMEASNQNLFQDADIVRIANEELQSVLVPYIESIKQEYFVKLADIAFDSTKSDYEIPSRATGNKLRDLALIDQLGNITNLPYIAPENLKSSWAFTPVFFGFYPQDTHVHLLLSNGISPASYAFLRLWYFRRPNTLCEVGQSGKVLAIDRGSGVVSLDSAPTTWTDSTTFDAISGVPPFQSKGDDLTISAISGFDLTFDAIPASLAVGDYIAEANESPIAQVPVECHRVLETLTAARMLQYSGDPSFSVMQQQADAEKRDLIQVMSPRVDGAPAKIPLRNRLWGSF